VTGGDSAGSDGPLEGASREAETLVAKLNAAARDLVEAMEGRLPADLESRYGTGDRKVYVHHLFLKRGASFLKQARTRYANERMVRGRIDAYLRLFERLLDAISESEDGSVLVDACLSSESGKVYLLLGQVSGREAKDKD
jgi:hypothetical protein